MPREALPCIACGRDLRNSFDDMENQPSEGLQFSADGHYGCTVFDPMDGQHLVVNVCDPCLVAAGREGKVLLGRHSRPVMVDNMVVGYERINRPYVKWDDPRRGAGDHEVDVVRVSADEVGSPDLSDKIVWHAGPRGEPGDAR